MEVFQAIGIIVSALLIYIVFTLLIVFMIAQMDDEGWPTAWLIGGVAFAVVSYCWITGVPLPVLK